MSDSKISVVIKPKVRGFICTSAHPKGCAKVVAEQIDFVQSKGKFPGPKRVLIIGGSTGYGLNSRIVNTYANDAKTIAVFYEKEASGKRSASAGWYNTAAFEKQAHADGCYAKSINGDAFSNEIKQQTIDLIKADLGQVDLVVYSLASPRRIHPENNEIFSSVLKPIGQSYKSKTVDPIRGELKEVTIEPATQKEIDNTIAVMGGEDWQIWIERLLAENLLAEGAFTIAYDYIGPEITHPIYKDGTIGQAKKHLFVTSKKINQQLQAIHGKAFLSVNKAIVTQASAAIPVVPLYISLLFKIMKAKGTHEDGIAQIYRMFHDKVYVKNGPIFDEDGKIRVDDLEMEAGTQQQVTKLWQQLTADNLEEVTDLKGYQADFYRLFGFGLKGIDYDIAVNPDVKIESLSQEH